MKFLRERAWLLVGVMGLLFWFAMRGAYKGYFMDDDLDNLSWIRNSLFSSFAAGLLSPKYFVYNFRPVGHFYFWVMERVAGMNYQPYVAVLHAAHIVNLSIVWLLAASFGLSTGARMIALLVFGFHMAAFDAYYRPMYIFDVLCATFCLLAILAWRKDRLWLSVLCAWLAYKSKELAIMLPLVLFCYELWFGGGRWKRLAPFFGISLLFGVQALLFRNSNPSEYSFVFTAAGLAQTLVFYSRQIAFLPYAGLVLLAMPFVTKNKLVWFGLAMGILFLGPVLFIPGRLYGAYLYLPLAGIGLAVAAILDRGARGAWIAFSLLAVVWIPVQYVKMRELRSSALFIADDNREYVSALRKLARVRPTMTTAVIDGAPAAMHRWGYEGALRYIFKNPHLIIRDVQELEASPVTKDDNVVLLSWDAPVRAVYIAARDSGDQESARIEMTRATPVWQFEKGFYPRDNGYRWIAPQARARLWRPVEANWFDVTVNIGPDYIRRVQKVMLAVKVDGTEIGRAEFTKPGTATKKWALPAAAAAATSKIEFEVSPPLLTPTDPRPLGIPIIAFGFRL